MHFTTTAVVASTVAIAAAHAGHDHHLYARHAEADALAEAYPEAYAKAYAEAMAEAEAEAEAEADFDFEGAEDHALFARDAWAEPDAWADADADADADAWADAEADAELHDLYARDAMPWDDEFDDFHLMARDGTVKNAVTGGSGNGLKQTNQKNAGTTGTTGSTTSGTDSDSLESKNGLLSTLRENKLGNPVTSGVNNQGPQKRNYQKIKNDPGNKKCLAGAELTKTYNDKRIKLVINAENQPEYLTENQKRYEGSKADCVAGQGLATYTSVHSPEAAQEKMKKNALKKKRKSVVFAVNIKKQLNQLTEQYRKDLKSKTGLDYSLSKHGANKPLKTDTQKAQKQTGSKNAGSSSSNGKSSDSKSSDSKSSNSKDSSSTNSKQN